MEFIIWVALETLNAPYFITAFMNQKKGQKIDKEKIMYKCRCNPSEVFLGKGVQKICSKITGEHSSRSAILLKLHFGMGVLL